MPNLPSRDELLVELRRQGLPAVYIERLLAELDEHARDFLEERNLEMGSKVDGTEGGRNESCFRAVAGDPKSLAVFSAAQYRQTRFAARHPLLTFIAAPLPMLIACFSAVVFVWAAAAYTVEALVVLPTDHDIPYIASSLLALLSLTLIAIPFFAAVTWMVRLASRSAVDWRWPATACCMISFVMAMANTSWRLSTAPENAQFAYMMQIGWPGSPIFNGFVLRFALFLSVGLLLLKRSRDRDLKSISPDDETPLRVAA